MSIIFYRAYSLIELLLAIALSLMLMMTVLTAFHAQSQLRQQQMAVEQVINHGRTARFLIRHTVQQAGFIGCRYLGADIIIDNPVPNLFSLTPLMVKHASGTVKFGSKKILPGSDFLITESMIDVSSVSTLNLSQHSLHTSRQVTFKVGQWLMLSDCLHAQLVQIKQLRNLNATQQLISFVQAFKYHFAPTAVIGHYVITRLFIANTSRYEHGHSVLALYRQQLRIREWVPNIQTMRLIHHGPEISSELLMVAGHNLFAQPMRFKFNQQYYLAADRRYYDVWLFNSQAWQGQ